MCGCNLVTPRLIGGGGRSSAGSLSMFAAIRRAPSRMKQLGRRAPPRLILEIDIGQRLAVVVAHYWSKRLVPRQSRAG